MELIALLGLFSSLSPLKNNFYGLGTTFDIFQNILFPYSLNTAYCLLMDTAYWILFPSWSLRANVTTIEESKDLSSLALDELIGNLKVHEVVMEKDSKIYKGKKERVKSIALKAKKESSYDETLTFKSDDEEYAMVVRNFTKFFRRKGKFVRQPRKEKKSFRQRDEKKGKSDQKCFRCGVSHVLTSYYQQVTVSKSCRPYCFNELLKERFISNNGESIDSYYHRFSKLMNDFKRKKYFPSKIASNLKFLNNLQPKRSRHVTIVHQTKELHTTDFTQSYDFLKYNQKEVDELRVERLAKTHDPLALMANSNNPFNYPVFYQDQPSSSTYMQQPQPNNIYNPKPSLDQKYMQQPMPNPEDITDPTTAMNMTLVLMAKAFKLNYSTTTNNKQRISSNPHNRQIAQPSMNIGQDRQMQMVGGNGGNQFRQYAGQNVKNQNGIANQNPNGNGNVVAASAEGNAIGNNGIQLQAEEFNLMVAAANLDEIKEVNANCILMDNLQQASTSCTQIDKAPVYDSYISVEINPFKPSREEKYVPNKVRASVRTNPITVSQPHFITKKDVNSDSNGLSSTGVDNTAKTIRGLCYLKNDREDIRKLGAKGDIGFFIGYSVDSCTYRVYNRRTNKIIETMNVTFDELSVISFKQSNSKPGLQSMTSRQISSGLDLTYAPLTITTQQPTEGKLDLLFESMYDDHIGGQPSAAPRTVSAAQAHQVP
nr:integrase, catalytic region, zinc finger, CCHC-type, peptidase aspartic, catalytic [Tanacetum cinerariifolium]